MRTVLALTLVAAILSVAGCSRWSKRDIALELSFAAVQAEDAYQTETIVRYCTETNPIIGTCGGRVNIPGYFVVTTLLHAGISAALPHGWWRTAWQGITLGAEADNVLGNQLTLDWQRTHASKR